MRRNRRFVALWLLAFMLLTGCSVTTKTEAGVSQEDIRLVVDGQELRTDVSPVIQNDRVLVPMRSLFEAVGLTVLWDEETRTVTGQNEETVISLKIGETEALRNGEKVTLDVPAVILNDRTFVPVRFVSESAGLYVEWIGDARTVSVRSKKLAVYFLDVGQADSAIVALPDGRSMLVDAGNRADADKVLRSLWTYGFGTLDYAIGTHPHEDHIGALSDVLLKVPVKTVIMPEKTTNTATFMAVLDAIEEKALDARYARPGVLTEGEGFLVEILSPIDVSGDDLNDASVVLRIVFGEQAVLLTGDATEKAEALMLKSDAVLNAGVLKVGHHGSDTSTSEAFLNRVSPKTAVISVGEGNTYGHPSDAVLNRLISHGITVYRTDLNGDIIFLTDGGTAHWRFDQASNVPSSPKESEEIGETVWVVGSGERYHKKDCRYVKDGESVREISLSDARSLGYTPCKVCNP